MEWKRQRAMLWLQHNPRWAVLSLEVAELKLPSSEAGRMGIFATFLAGQNIPALISKGALELRDGHRDFSQSKLHFRRIWAAAILRTNQAGHYVLGLAGLARETPCRPS